MARYNAKGIENLELSMREFAEIPDDVIEEMLEAGGYVVKTAQRRKILALGLVDSGKLRDSIKVVKKAGSVSNGWKRFVLVYPAGTHGSYRRRSVTKAYKRSRSGRTYTVGGDIRKTTNSEVGFIQEFGAPKKGIKPKQWMKLANEESADAMVEAEFAVYDKWLKSKDL